MKKVPVILLVLIEMMVSMGWSQNAPVTKAQTVLDPVQGSVVGLAVTVTGFSGIGSFTLTLDYNQTVVSVANVTMHPGLEDCTVDWITTPGRITFNWTRTSGLTLSDHSHLADITFSYSSGGNTFLVWYDNGSSCQYSRFVDGGPYTVLNDSPQNSFYIDGLISGDASPVTLAPVITDASEGPLDIDILTTGFNDIGAISLTLQYDPTILVFMDFYTVNPLLSENGTFMVSTYPGTGGNTNISISWIKNPGPGVPVISLPDSTQIISMAFFYADPLGTSSLHWFDDGSSCEYANGNLDALWDLPTSTFYRDGLVTWQRSAPKTSAPDVSAAGETVCVPVTVTGFSEIGAISLTLDYDPQVLTFQNITFSSIPFGWNLSGQAATPGRLVITGFGPSFTLPGDTDVLFNACFAYLGGSSLLSWYDDGPSCEYSDGISLDPLYDSPPADYYYNGFIEAHLAAQFTASDTTPLKNTDVIFTDLSSGNPSGWTWTFDPPGPVTFVNGTSANSQNPQVQFSDGGAYTVSLSVTNATGTSLETKPGFIMAGAAGLWSGDISSEWTLGTNWDNHIAPDSSTDVLIPSFSPNWPVFQGNLTIGVHCHSILLLDINSRLTITGNLIIN